MKKECSNQDKISLIGQLMASDRIDVNERYPYLDKDARIAKYKNAKQIDNRLKGLLQKLRDDLIKPQHTPKAYKRGLVGGEICDQGKRLQARTAKKQSHQRSQKQAKETG